VKFWMSDNGGEYTSSEYKEYLASEVIEHRTEWPEQNAVAERMNQTLTECARSIRLMADMLEDFLSRDSESCKLFSE